MKTKKLYYKMCANKTCCPVIQESEDSGNYQITDDYGGKVKLTKEELKLLKDFLSKQEDI
jgi:hypothetical protein